MAKVRKYLCISSKTTPAGGCAAKVAIDFRSGFSPLFLIPFDLYKDLVACYNTFVSFKLSSEDLS